MLGLDLDTIIARAVVLLVAFTIHELAHAVTADYLGDPTPRRMGRITLNPIAHLDPFGTIMLLISGFGWAKPVMVNPLNLRGNYRTSMAVVALAGPVSNLLMALVFAIPLRFIDAWPMALRMSVAGDKLAFLFFQFVWINLILMFFNLIPIPPLDGFKVLQGALPPEMSYQLRPLEQYGFLILMLVVFILPNLGLNVLNWVVVRPSLTLMSMLTGL
ncbi:MAG: site-2 protease family protein [Ardenticatenaceae bacterium]|nr:site-2 protease family protein [Ardenticatenaceae bacterium]MCB9442755.1 site-2 protease family protein [Ardenticatenaceae bacterium]